MNHHPLYAGLSRQTDLPIPPLPAKQRCSHLAHAISTTTAVANIKAMHGTKEDDDNPIYSPPIHGTVPKHEDQYVNCDALVHVKDLILICALYSEYFWAIQASPHNDDHLSGMYVAHSGQVVHVCSIPL